MSMPSLGKPLLQCQLGNADDGLKVPMSAFWMVCLTVFIDSLGGSISGPVLPFYAKMFGASSQGVGILFSAFSAAQVIFLPIFGRLSDHFGRRQVLVTSLFGAAIGAWSQGLAPNFSMLVLARILSGACGAVGSTANVYVSDITSASVRGQYLGYVMNSNGAAFAFGPGLGGGLSRFGLNVPIEVNGVMCFLAGLLAMLYLPESPVFLRRQHEAARRSIEAHDSASDTESCRGSGLSRAVWAICTVEFLRGLSFSAIFAMYGLFALKVYNLDSLHIGYAVCVGAITLICTNVWITGPLQHALGEIYCAAFGVFLMSIGELILAFVPCLAISLLGMWQVYMGQAIAGATIASITCMLSTEDNRGQIMSMQQTAQALGRVFGPLILGGLAEIDPRYPFVLAALTTFIAGGLLASLRNEYQRQFEVNLIPSPQPVAKQLNWDRDEYTREDVQEMGLFLCDLLTAGHYRWREQETKEQLKEALKAYFPPLDLISLKREDSIRTSIEGLPAPRKMSAVVDAQAFGHMVSLSGDDSNFIKSPMLSTPATRRRFGSKTSVVQRAPAAAPARPDPRSVTK